MPPIRPFNRQKLAEQEERISIAVKAIEKHENLSIRQAAKTYNIPRTTLYGRLHGRQTRVKLHPNSSKLTANEEDSLKQWIVSLYTRGAEVRPSMVREMANLILADRATTPTQTVGQNWVTNYVKRHPEVDTILSRRCIYDHTKCEGPKIITPTPPPSRGSQSSAWEPKTASIYGQLQQQAESIKESLKERSKSPPSPSNSHVDQVLQASLMTMQSTALLVRENELLRAGHEDSTRNESRSQLQIAHPEGLPSSLSSAIDQVLKACHMMMEAIACLDRENELLGAEPEKVKRNEARSKPQIAHTEGLSKELVKNARNDQIQPLIDPPTDRPAAQERRSRAPPKCSDCGVQGHKRTHCPNLVK